MAQIPYILQLQVTLTASGQGTLTYTVPNNEELDLREWVFSSTGVFGITGIRVTGGNTLTNASNNQYIPNTHLPMAVAETNNISKFYEPLIIKGGSTLQIDLLDTSVAGNTVKCSIAGIRKV